MSFKPVGNLSGQIYMAPSLLPQITAAEVTGANNGSRPDLLAFPDKVYALSTDNRVLYKVQAGVMSIFLPAAVIPREDRNTGTANYTIPDFTDVAILAGSGTITLTFPATVYDGEELVITLETAYTAITLAGNGRTLVTGAALGVSAGSFARYRYRAANTTWHRVG
jgi:hypothetical protein